MPTLKVLNKNREVLSEEKGKDVIMTLKKAIFWVLYTLYIHKREITKES